MRDEFLQLSRTGGASKTNETDSGSSQRLTRVGGQQTNESNNNKPSSNSNRSKYGLDKGASLTLARKGMRLKSKGLVVDLSHQEVSERRQVGDAESIMDESRKGGREPWWRNVTMEEGL